jgi:serine phosphatase RsbU (regulator of sigma subunit)
MLLTEATDRRVRVATGLPRSHTAIVATAAATALTVFVLGALLETWLISLLQPSEGELTWISDLFLAGCLGVAIYLWLDLRFTRAALAELERSKIVLDTQFAVAAKIQRDLLPATPSPRRGVSWAVRLVQAGRIGGDYYDFIDLDGRSRIAVVGDIAGKGIPAAMMLVYVRALFRQAVRETREPAAVIARLSKALYAETRAEPYLTCIVVRFDEEPRRLTFSVAGHPPALAIGGMQQRLVDGGPPAGLLPDAEYDQETVALPPASRVVVVTDGITERLADFEAAVAAIDPRQPANALCDSIFHLSEAPDASAPVDGWDDDRTVLVLAVD